MKLSEAILSGDVPLTNRLVKEALARLVDEMAEEYLLRREHKRYDGQNTRKVTG
tara:strand:- start:819 stop:980 length:162 start_codon:yes stop_codon:yes gene_type:complete